MALVCGAPGRWRCAALAPSYESFLALAEGVPVDWSAATFGGGLPRPRALLAAARRLGGAEVGVVAVDMPLATVSITGRRAAESALAREFARRGCAAHSPSRIRPGPVSDRLRTALSGLGFRLATERRHLGQSRRLLEVYPHAALLALLAAPYRLPCKVSRIRQYWPRRTRAGRVAALLAVWARIRAALAAEFEGLSLPLPAPASVRTLAALKRYEDALDALVCAWAGTRFVTGHARPYGDPSAAIWVPTAARSGRAMGPRPPSPGRRGSALPAAARGR